MTVHQDSQTIRRAALVCAHACHCGGSLGDAPVHGRGPLPASYMRAPVRTAAKMLACGQMGVALRLQRGASRHATDQRPGQEATAEFSQQD